MDKRILLRWHWHAVHRLGLLLCDPDDGEIIVALQWGDKHCDPVWSIDLRLTGLVARPFIAWAGYRWDKAVERQNRVRA